MLCARMVKSNWSEGLLGGLLVGGWGLERGTWAAGGLGMVTHLNEADIMKKNGWACPHHTSSVRFNLVRNTFKIVPAALWAISANPCRWVEPLTPFSSSPTHSLSCFASLAGWDAAISALYGIIESTTHSRSQWGVVYLLACPLCCGAPTVVLCRFPNLNQKCPNLRLCENAFFSDVNLYFIFFWQNRGWREGIVE